MSSIHSSRTFAVALAILLMAPAYILAQDAAPDSISFQGRLTDPSGTPYDATVSMTFKLYDGNTPLWTENHPAVVVDSGIFNVVLGNTARLDTMAFNKVLDLGVTVEGDEEISPRTSLTAVPYARALPGLYTFYRDDGSLYSYNVVGGASGNEVGSAVVGGTIGGGGGGFLAAGQFANRVLENFGTVGGGRKNATHGIYATIGGGISNSADGESSTIGGGESNIADGFGSTITGGDHNTAYGASATVSGNHNGASGDKATVGGGEQNSASGEAATVAGGYQNTATGLRSIVPGGWENRAGGDYSFAAGHDAKAAHDGTFVWNDRSVISGDDSLVSTGPNQFLIRAAGGVGIGTNEPRAFLHVQRNDLDVGEDEYAREGLLVEKADAVIGAYSGDGGSYGSALVLAEMDEGSLISKWAIVRETSFAGSSLQFKYGSDDLYENNDTQFEIKAAGEVLTSGDLLPGTDNVYSLGSNGQVWTEVYAASGMVSTSDRRLKTDIRKLSAGLDAVMQLDPVSYRWRSRPDAGRELGLIAQDVESVVPEVVNSPETDESYYGLNYAELVPVLIKAIQEQQDRIDALEDLVAQLQPLSASQHSSD